MNNLVMPPCFPEEQFDRIHQAIDQYRANANYLQFQGAWNAVAYRYKAMIEYDEGFTASILTDGRGPAEPLRYRQERDLFGFVSNAYSMFDAIHYAMYVVGSFVDTNHFKLSDDEDERNVNFSNTKKAFAAAFDSDPINQHFSSFANDPVRRDLDSIRNMFTHRASPPRAFRLSTGGPNRAGRSSASFTRLELEIDNQTTASRTAEARRLLSACLDALEAFIASEHEVNPESFTQ
jgi:hypothetical protein